MKTVAKMLGYSFGNITLFRILRECAVLDRYNTPYEEYLKKEFFEEDINPMQKGYQHLQTYVLGQRGLDFVKKVVDEYLKNHGNSNDEFILIDDTNE